MSQINLHVKFRWIEDLWLLEVGLDLGMFFFSYSQSKPFVGLWCHTIKSCWRNIYIYCIHVIPIRSPPSRFGAKVSCSGFEDLLICPKWALVSLRNLFMLSGCHSVFKVLLLFLFFLCDLKQNSFKMSVRPSACPCWLTHVGKMCIKPTPVMWSVSGSCRGERSTTGNYGTVTSTKGSHVLVCRCSPLSPAAAVPWQEG